MNFQYYRDLKESIERYSDHTAWVSHNGSRWYVMERIHDLGGTDYSQIETLTEAQALALVDNKILPLWFGARDTYDRLVAKAQSGTRT